MKTKEIVQNNKTAIYYNRKSRWLVFDEKCKKIIEDRRNTSEKYKR